MSDYKKAQRGQELSIPATTYNAMVDAAVYVKQIGGSKKNKQGITLNSTVAIVKNTSGATVERFRAMQVSGPIIEPDDTSMSSSSSSSGSGDMALREFKRRVALKLVTPTEDGAGLWCVLQEPLADGKLGQAVFLGLTVAIVDLQSASDTFAESQAGETILTSGASGSAQIMWVAGGVGSATTTGEQLAVIKLGAGGGGELPVGQYPGMAWLTIADNVTAFAYPFAVQTV